MAYWGSKTTREAMERLGMDTRVLSESEEEHE